MPYSLSYFVHKILNIFALFIFFDVPTLDHAFSSQIMLFMVSKEEHTSLHRWWNALFAFPFCITLYHEAEKKESFWDRYFACCFNCCETWICQDLTDLLVLVQYILGVSAVDSVPFETCSAYQICLMLTLKVTITSPVCVKDYFMVGFGDFLEVVSGLVWFFF